METPNYHDHKYNPRSKRSCYLCSSIQEPNIRNQDSITCVSTQNKRLVAAFPDELMFNILLLIPAKLLYENMRFVSRFWRESISSPCFTTNHFQISSSAHTHGLLVDQPAQENLNNDVAFYINPDFHVTELSKPPFHCRIRGSYHGLVLLQHKHNIDQFYVVNLVTKSVLSTLPCFPLIANLYPDNEDGITDVAFSYASSNSRYKVVIWTRPWNRSSLSYTPPQVWVCTVGVDQHWRKLELKGIDEIWGSRNQIPFQSPKSVGGFVYRNDWKFPYGFALDVNTEKFYRFNMPRIPNTLPRRYWIICLQTGLGLVVTFGYTRSPGQYDFWELYQLTDLKSSEWAKIIEIDFSVIRSQIKKYYQYRCALVFKPLVYTNDEKLWFCCYYNSTALFYYNLRDPSVIPIRVIENRKIISAYHHVNTLQAFNNC